MSLQTTAAELQATLLRREQAAANAMIRAYAAGWRAIRADLDSLVRRIESMRAAGEIITPTVVMRQRQLESLLNQTEEQIGLFARLASRRVQKEQREAIEAARKNAETLFYEQLPNIPELDVTFAQLPK